MPHRRTTFSKFIIEQQKSDQPSDTQLTALLNDIQTACKFIAVAVSRGALLDPPLYGGAAAGHTDPARSLPATADEIIMAECTQGGTLGGVLSEARPEPVPIPAGYRRGPYVLAFNPLDDPFNLDIDSTVGTIFSVLPGPANAELSANDFLQPGTAQIAAGFALYGPCSMFVVTTGNGVHGFTLDREIGAYTLTHPDMRIPEETNDVAIDASNERFWEEPVRHYISECLQGLDGDRGEDFDMRWAASLVASVHRTLIRGGIFIDPLITEEPHRAGRLRLLYEANPMAMIVEQAGGVATTGRERILDLVPESLHECVPVILGSRREVERLAEHHAAHDRGEDLRFESPFFNTRSFFRTI